MHKQIVIAILIISVKNLLKADDEVIDNYSVGNKKNTSKASEINIDLQPIQKELIGSKKFEKISDKFLKEISKFEDIDWESDISAVNDNKTNILVKIYEIARNSNKSKGEYDLRQINHTSAIIPLTENDKTLNQTNHYIEPDIKDIADDFLNINNDKIEEDNNDNQNRIRKKNNLKSLLIDFAMNYETIDNINDTDYSYPDIDYLEIYKDTINDDAPAPYLTHVTDVTTTKTDSNDSIDKVIGKVEIEDEFENKTFSTCHGVASDLKSAVFPWIAKIFVVDELFSRYKHVCDGVLVKPDSLLTSVRCLMNGTKTIDPEDILVTLGEHAIDSGYNKTELVNSIAFPKHINQEGTVIPDDMAILLLSTTSSATTSIGRNIKTACIKTGQEENQNSTFYTIGRKDDKLINIKLFGASPNECQLPAAPDNAKLLCFKYSTELTTCPSHGGLLYEITENKNIYFRGIRYSNTSLENYCFGNYVIFSRVDFMF